MPPGPRGRALLGLGANIEGAWGAPDATLRRAVAVLKCRGVSVVAKSAIYASPPLGPPGQPDYLNAVLLVASARPALALLAVVKEIERLAGRRSGQRWGARPLDIDLLDVRRTVLLARGRSVRGRPSLLRIPHGEITRRVFVLRPLADVAPFWTHPANGTPVATLLRALPPRARRIRRTALTWSDDADGPLQLD